MRGSVFAGGAEGLLAVRARRAGALDVWGCAQRTALCRGAWPAGPRCRTEVPETSGRAMGALSGGGSRSPTSSLAAPSGEGAAFITDSELERVFDGDEGGGDDALDKYIDGVVADDALGDWEMGVSSGAHGGAGF